MNDYCSVCLVDAFPKLHISTRYSTDSIFQRLEFKDCIIHHGFMSQLAQSCVQLSSLCIFGCTFTDGQSGVIELLQSVGRFENLSTLSIFFTDSDSELPLGHLCTAGQKLSLTTLALSRCTITGMTEFLAHAPYLTSLTLNYNAYLPHDTRIVSTSLQILYIDVLRLGYNLSCTDLPSLTCLTFCYLDLAGAPVDDLTQLRSMVAALAALPLQARSAHVVYEEDEFELRGESEWDEQQSLSVLQILSESSLPAVLSSVKSLSVSYFQFGPGSMRVLSALFTGGENVCVSEFRFSDTEGIDDAVLLMPSLRGLTVDMKEGSSVPSVLPALYMCRQAGREFDLQVTPCDELSCRQLQAISRQWDFLTSKHLGGPGDIVFNKDVYLGY